MTNWDGMYPSHNCKQCSKKLNSNNQRPAELYAGTYTGLCYTCQSMSAYIVTCYKIDSCLIVSHPPNSPSHRRDRSSHYTYIDCQVCKGTGHIYQSRSFASGGGYYNYCKICLLERYYKQPMRIAYNEMVEEIQETKITPFKALLDKQFSSLVPSELKEKKYGEYTKEDKKLWTKLAEPFLKQFDAFRKKALHMPNLLYSSAYEKVEYKPGTILLSDR